MLRRGFQKPFRLNHAKNASIFVAAFGCEGFDAEKIDAYASQFEAIATIISEKASSAIESFNEFDVTNVGVPKKFKPFLIGIARLTPTASAASVRSYRQASLPLRRSPRTLLDKNLISFRTLPFGLRLAA